MKTKHTPLPWRIGDLGYTVFGTATDQPSPVVVVSGTPTPRVSAEERKANNKLIITAVNHHDRLVAELKKAERFMSGFEDCEINKGMKVRLSIIRELLDDVKNETKLKPNTIDISRSEIADVMVPNELWDGLINSEFPLRDEGNSYAMLNGEDFQFEVFINEETMDGDVKDFLQRLHHQLSVDNQPWPDEIRFNREGA